MVMTESVMGRNDPPLGYFGAGSLLYKGHMNQMLVITDTSAKRKSGTASVNSDSQWSKHEAC